MTRTTKLRNRKKSSVTSETPSFGRRARTAGMLGSERTASREVSMYKFLDKVFVNTTYPGGTRIWLGAEYPD